MPLAYYKPASPVPKFKYARGGQSELCRGVAGPNHKLFYQGWASYLRAAYGHNGSPPPPTCLRAQRQPPCCPPLPRPLFS